MGNLPTKRICSRLLINRCRQHQYHLYADKQIQASWISSICWQTDTGITNVMCMLTDLKKHHQYSLCADRQIQASPISSACWQTYRSITNTLCVLRHTVITNTICMLTDLQKHNQYHLCAETYSHYQYHLCADRRSHQYHLYADRPTEASTLSSFCWYTQVSSTSSRIAAVFFQKDILNSHIRSRSWVHLLLPREFLHISA